ncbi:MAG: STAS domain-containing protein [Acidobacteria bacterium]|nr:STAS domain-containing protein [Acidobacteriota bacterium]
MLLQIDTKQIEPDVTVLTFSGKITLGRESQRIEMLVKELLQQNRKKLVFDLAGVTYIDSTGLGIITFCSATAQAGGGALRVAGASGIAEKLFQMTRLDKIIPLYPSVDQACQDFTLPA